MSDVHKFVITGGPCAGKTTALVKVRDYCSKNDIFLVVVPEIARLFISNGIDPRMLKDPNQNRLIQKNIVSTQIEWEWSATNFAEIRCKETGQRGLVVCDRGVCDNGAYMDRADYRWVLAHPAHFGMTPERALKRYDAVFHLQSAAVGAAEHYKTDPVRTDSVEDAAKLDGLTMMQWDTHPRFHLIPNPIGGFEVKMNILVEHIDDEIRYGKKEKA